MALKYPKINAIIILVCYQEKRCTLLKKKKIVETNKILKAKYKNLPETYFMDQDSNWLKSNMVLSENVYYKNIIHLVETCNERYFKSICLFLIQNQDIHHHHCHHFYVLQHHHYFHHHYYHHPFHHH